MKFTTENLRNNLKMGFPSQASLEPPDSVKASCPKWESVALQHLEDVSIDTISMHFIDGGKDKGQGSSFTLVFLRGRLNFELWHAEF